MTTLGTVVKVHRRNDSNVLEWSIPRFSTLSSDGNEYYHSPLFKCWDTSWYLIIYINGWSGYSSEVPIALSLCAKEVVSPFTVRFTLSFKHVDGREEVRREDSCTIEEGRVNYFWWCSMIQRSELLRRKSEFLPDDVLTVCCTLESCDRPLAEASVAPSAPVTQTSLATSLPSARTPSKKSGSAAVQPSSPTCPEVHSKTFASASVQTAYATSCLVSLAEDLSKMLDAESDTDVELRCEGHTAKAHKNVLSARSPVLDSMLHSDMVEGKTGVANILDMDVDTFRRFLRYAYTGQLDELTVDSATSLYEAGDMYGLKSLAKRCSEFLIENLTVKNACDILALADAHSDAECVEAVTVYIMEEKIPLSGDLWRDFCKSHPVLGCEVLNRYMETLAGSGFSKK